MSSARAEAIHVEGLTCRRAGRPVVRDVSFAIEPGEVVAVIGPNGAGKTTLLDAVVGVQEAERGGVLHGRRRLRTLAERARVLSFMPDDAAAPAEVRVADLLAHAARFGHPPVGLADELIARLDLGPLTDAHAGALSRGERRRLALFLALCTSRPVVVLDEPLGTFDPLQLRSITALLRERAQAGMAILMSVHQMSDAQKIADRVLLLDAGRMVALGTLEELRARVAAPSASLEEVFLALLERERQEGGLA